MKTPRTPEERDKEEDEEEESLKRSRGNNGPENNASSSVGRGAGGLFGGRGLSGFGAATWSALEDASCR